MDARKSRKTNKRSVIKTIPIDGYPLSFLLCVGATETQIKRVIYKKVKGEQHNCSSDCHSNEENLFNVGFMKGKTVFLHCNYAVLLLNKEMLEKNSFSANMIAHECFHVIKHTMKKIQIPLSSSTEEAWAYMLGNMVENVHAALYGR